MPGHMLYGEAFPQAFGYSLSDNFSPGILLGVFRSETGCTCTATLALSIFLAMPQWALSVIKKNESGIASLN